MTYTQAIVTLSLGCILGWFSHVYAINRDRRSARRTRLTALLTFLSEWRSKAQRVIPTEEGKIRAVFSEGIHTFHGQIAGLYPLFSKGAGEGCYAAISSLTGNDFRNAEDAKALLVQRIEAVCIFCEKQLSHRNA